jgi:plasmid stabilization system protein ParE
MTRVTFHPEAEAELDNARTWYRERNQVAGRAFVAEVLSALKSIAETPEAWPRTRANERRFVFKRFPYSII